MIDVVVIIVTDHESPTLETSRQCFWRTLEGKTLVGVHLEIHKHETHKILRRAGDFGNGD